MTLHEAIYKTLTEADRPMTSREVADTLNSNNIYVRKDNNALTASQVSARIGRYPQEFDYIQGEIILTKNTSWSDLLRSYKYLQNLYFNNTRIDKSSLIVFMYFYKRISDISEYKTDYNLPIQARINSLRNIIAHGSTQTLIDNFKSGIQYLTSEFSNLSDFFYQQLESIRYLNDKVIFETFNVLSSFETSKLEDKKFGRIFEYLIQKSFNINKDGYYFTPQPVADLFGSLISGENVTEIYDPCAGLGGLITEINKQSKSQQISYFASELNTRVASLGTLNLILNGVRNFEFKNADFLAQPFNKKFDLIASDLPIISKINDNIDFNLFQDVGLPIPTRKSGTAALVLYIVTKLKKGGKAFLTVPEGFLFRKGFDEKARKFLIDNSFLEAVISLPANALNPYTSVKASILCLTANHSEQVKFINGGISLNSSNDIIVGALNSDEIVKAYRSIEADSRISSIVPNSSIKENEYILSVDQYNEIYVEAGKLIEEGNAKHLETIAIIQSGTSSKNINDLNEGFSTFANSETLIRIIKAENLKKDILDLKINTIDFNNYVSRDNNSEKAILSKKCLLIARVGDNPKPTIFDPNDFDTPVAIHRGVYAMIPAVNSQISVEYLYYQFYSPFVQQQLNNSQIGATIPHISITNLNKLVIPVIDLIEQNKLVSTQRANLIQVEKEKIEKRLKMLGYEKEVADKESDIVRVLVHQLRPTFLSLNSQVESILRIVNKNHLEQFVEFIDTPDFSDPELLALGILPNKPANHTLLEICNKLLNDSKEINNKLTYVNKVMAFNLGKDDFQETEIKSFIQKHVNTFLINKELKFKVEVTGEICNVEFNRESMGELIDQLIHNAQTHAFNETNTTHYLRFQIKRNKQAPVVTIEYTNNGRDFNLSLEQFVSPFQKSQNSNGSGIGGYYIKRIVEAHDGALMLNDKIKKGFSLTIELPINHKNNADE